MRELIDSFRLLTALSNMDPGGWKVRNRCGTPGILPYRAMTSNFVAWPWSWCCQPH